MVPFDVGDNVKGPVIVARWFVTKNRGTHFPGRGKPSRRQGYFVLYPSLCATLRRLRPSDINRLWHHLSGLLHIISSIPKARNHSHCPSLFIAQLNNSDSYHCTPRDPGFDELSRPRCLPGRGDPERKFLSAEQPICTSRKGNRFLFVRLLLHGSLCDHCKAHLGSDCLPHWRLNDVSVVQLLAFARLQTIKSRISRLKFIIKPRSPGLLD